MTAVLKGSRRGRPRKALMAQLVITGTDKDGSKAYWCVAEGCDWTKKGNKAEDRVQAHTSKCSFLQKSKSEEYRKLWRLANEAQSGSSLGAKLQEREAEKSVESASKKGKAKSSQSTPDPTQPSVLESAREAGKQKAAKRKSEAIEKLQQEVDHLIMCLVCVRGFVPHIIDTPEWKDLLSKLNPDIHMTSSSTFVDNLIPKEAVFVRAEQEKRIKKSPYSTLSFDGTNTRLNSIYLLHATTATRESFFVNAYIGSDTRHISVWMSSRVLQVR